MPSDVSLAGDERDIIQIDYLDKVMSEVWKNNRYGCGCQYLESQLELWPSILGDCSDGDGDQQESHGIWTPCRNLPNACILKTSVD
jgi:hypothetical protein